MQKSISRILILTKRNILEIIRDPLSLIFTIGLPLFMEILFIHIKIEILRQGKEQEYNRFLTSMFSLESQL